MTRTTYLVTSLSKIRKCIKPLVWWSRHGFIHRQYPIRLCACTYSDHLRNRNIVSSTSWDLTPGFLQHSYSSVFSSLTPRIQNPVKKFVKPGVCIIHLIFHCPQSDIRPVRCIEHDQSNGIQSYSSYQQCISKANIKSTILVLVLVFEDAESCYQASQGNEPWKCGWGKIKYRK